MDTHKSSNNETVVVQQRCAVEKRERASALLRPHLRFPPELFWFITYTSNDLHKCGEVFQQLIRHKLMKLFVTVWFFPRILHQPLKDHTCSLKQRHIMHLPVLHVTLKMNLSLQHKKCVPCSGTHGQ